MASQLWDHHHIFGRPVTGLDTAESLRRRIEQRIKWPVWEPAIDRIVWHMQNQEKRVTTTTTP